MRFRWTMLMLGLIPLLLGACAKQENLPITLASDKLTFLFFYTEG
jgi:hypothetical protein